MHESVPRLLNSDLREWTESEASGASTDVSEGIERVEVAVRTIFDSLTPSWLCLDDQGQRNTAENRCGY